MDAIRGRSKCGRLPISALVELAGCGAPAGRVGTPGLPKSACRLTSSSRPKALGTSTQTRMRQPSANSVHLAFRNVCHTGALDTQPCAPWLHAPWCTPVAAARWDAAARSPDPFGPDAVAVPRRPPRPHPPRSTSRATPNPPLARSTRHRLDVPSRRVRQPRAVVARTLRPRHTSMMKGARTWRRAIARFPEGDLARPSRGCGAR
jgi:hypothetical protein